MFFGISKTTEFDYHIFIEDDYIAFKDYFELDLIKEYDKTANDVFLCCYYYKNIKFNAIDYCKTYNNETSESIEYIDNQFKLYNFDKNVKINVPDFSLGILSKNTVDKILNKFKSFDNIKNFFNIKLYKLELYQILFGCILNICNVNICDISENYLNIFYQSLDKSIYICNFTEQSDVINWRTKLSKKYKNPIFIPLNILYPNNYDNDLNIINNYIEDDISFKTIYENLNNIKKKYI